MRDTPSILCSHSPHLANMDSPAWVIDYATVFTPAACFILTAPLRLRALWSRSVAVKSATLLQLTKSVSRLLIFSGKRLYSLDLGSDDDKVVSILFVAMNLTILLLNSSNTGSNTPSVRLGPPILAFVAACVSVLLSQWEHSRSIRPSHLLQTYLLLSLLGRLVHVYTHWPDVAATTERAIEISVCVTTAAFLTIESIQKDAFLTSRKRYPPQVLRGVFGQRLFLWLNRLFHKGYNTVFNLNSLDRIDEVLSSLDDCRRLRMQWLKIRTQASHDLLLRSICRSIYVDLLFPIIPRVLLLAVNFAQPWLVQRLLGHVAQPTRSTREGVLLICATATTYTCLAIFQSWYWQSVCRFQTKVRFCLITAIYDKSLRCRTKASPLTLMNVDVEKALFGIRPVHEYWAATLSIVVAFGLLYTQIGVCFIAPLTLVLTLVTVTVINGTSVGPKQKVWLETTQARIGYIMETMNTMKAIKLHGLVTPTILQGTALREQEVHAQRTIRKSLLINTIISQTAFVALALVTYCAFGVRTRITGEPLINDKLFTSLAILKLISTPMLGAVQFIPNTLQSLAALQRIQAFLEVDDQIDQRTIQHSRTSNHSTRPEVPAYASDGQIVASLSNVSCGYSPAVPVLENLTWDFRKNRLVGSGKSTLLKALLGEVDINRGSVHAPGVVAYCDQSPWLWDGTIEENIMGIYERDESWLQRVIWACGLEQDMRRMPVPSAIGNGGSSLSGGQRNRVSLARAVYSREKFVLLDDPLSGLDSRTETIVFTRVLGPQGILKSNGCTVILATNSKHWTSYSDSTIVIEKGTAIAYDLPQRRIGNAHNVEARFRPLLDQSSSSGLLPSNSACEDRLLDVDQANLAPKPGSDLEVYKQYFISFGLYHTIFYFALLVASVGAVQTQSVWLKKWSTAKTTGHGELTIQILVFTAISCAAITCLGLLFGFSLLKLLVRASLHLHARQWTALMNVKFVAWVSKDVGSIINRFSQDIMIIDTQLAMAFINTTMQVCTSIASIVLLMVATPYIGAVIPFLCAIFWAIQRIYLRTSKQLRTLDLEAKAPLCTHFLRSISGLSTIKSFGWAESYRETNIRLLRDSQIPYYLLASIQNWLSLVLNLVVAGLATMVVAIAFNLSSLDSGYFGLALTSIMDLGFYFEVLITSWTSLETSLGAIARMNQFVRELPRKEEDEVVPSSSWPAQGELLIQDLTASYSEDSAASPVLRNVTLHVRPGEKVAICGRTGSGKSSIIAAIFGLLHVNYGSITIDGLDTKRVESKALRSTILLLTQDPYFTPGTVRQNLLLHESGPVPDSAIVSALERTKLLDKFNAIEGDTNILDMTLLPEDMLTKGEMQLFAIARILLSNTKILVLDEPTSGLDPGSDEVVRSLLWDHCTVRNLTIITIAHKLQSIINFDTVVVVDEGHIKEKGRPSELAAMDGSMFAQLLLQSS
ncbi:P-loop containing nucleoside triphosphate hydrolase protein [Aureobasidium pullulans]|uniref:P-loop containing nucleoside triphosphate hydrolase protein n=1 Tax=Aureobasidium pullulans TaxID=5580 RepID=A0AB74JCL4_AURPU|nr:P-loop containing nucleoside triphosphate hydrolase protein [Aureobasidium pullulans]